MIILIVSDAWEPQINGVVRTLKATAHELQKKGHKVSIITVENNNRFCFSLPFYKEIKLEFFSRKRLQKIFDDLRPDYIHIATEGPLGWTARNLCINLNLPFTTAYHTKYPEYLAARTPRYLSSIMCKISYAVLRLFHAPSAAVMVPTESIKTELYKHGFNRLVVWPRGVDTNLFRPYGKDLSAYAFLPRPILLYVGRISSEKNLPAFLDIDCEGSKVVIGDGPALVSLRDKYPHAYFLGAMHGENLARHYAAADIFVFPSLTETFGLVLLEACAAGLRIASYPSCGPSDIFANPISNNFAALNKNLKQAIITAINLPDDPNIPRQFAESFSWEVCTEKFFGMLSGYPDANEKR